MCRADASAKSVNVRLDLRASRHVLRGDPAKLQQVFCNLLKNAIKFSNARGGITVRSSDEGADVAEDRGHRRGRRHRTRRAPARLQRLRAGGEGRHRSGSAGWGWAWRSARGSSRPTAGSFPRRATGRGKGTTLTVALARCGRGTAEGCPRPRLATAPTQVEDSAGRGPRGLSAGDVPAAAEARTPGHDGHQRQSVRWTPRRPRTSTCSSATWVCPTAPACNS